MNEKVSVSVPNAGVHIIDLEVRPDEGDDEIAIRLAKTFPVGTVVGVGGAKWRITSKDPPCVHEVGTQNVVQALAPMGVPSPKPKPREPLVAKVPTLLSAVNDQLRPLPGERWKPRDPRRKSGFTIKAVTDTEVIAEDGRTVSLDRMKRYEKIG